MTDVSKLVVEVEAKGIKPTTEQLENLSASGAKAEKNTGKVGKAAKSTVAPMKNMRAQAQQASYQFQDIAVQAQMGTNAFTIIGQQGSQLASVFGPAGAVTGALIAFGAILGRVVYDSLNTAGEAMASLEEDMKSLEENFDSLGEASKAYVRTLVTKRIEGYSAAIAEQSKELEKGAKVAYQGFLATRVQLETSEEFAERQGVISAEIERLNHLKEQDIKLIDETTGSTESLIKSLSEEAGALGKSGVALALHKAGLAEANAEDREKIRILAEQIAKHKELEETNKAEKSDADKFKQESAAASKYVEQLTLLGLTEEQNFAEVQTRKLAKLKEDLAKGLIIQQEYSDAVDALAGQASLRDDKAGLKLEKEKASAQARLLQIEQSAMDEAALLDSTLNANATKLAEDYGNKLINEEQFLIGMKALNEKYSKDGIALALAEAQAKADIQQQVISSMSGMAGQLAGIAEEGSKEAKALFAIQKALAIAQIIVSTEVAANAAGAQASLLTGFVGFLASAAGIRAMGYASAGIVAGTAIAGGRALGGQVRGGESYLIGERGPELLTMGSSGRIATNENLKKAVGSESGQAQANVSVNFSIQANDTAGFDRLLNSRRGQIVSMINQAVNNRGRASLT